MSDSDLNPVSNVGDLRRLIDGLAEQTPVRIHFGWDVGIAESGFDDEDGAVILFADTESGVSTVSTDWLNKQRAGKDA